MTSTGDVLWTRELAVGYGSGRQRTTVLAQLDLHLAQGQLTCLLGPNGSGKSTLLRTLAGMQDPLAGDVTLLGDDVRTIPAMERARRLGVVLTDRVDAGIMRGADLVALGRYPYTGWSGRLRGSDHHAVRWAMAATGADRFADRNVTELSDGERQRVLLARALAQQPRVLALDEPTAYVDVARRVELAGLLQHLARECELAVLMTTHDLDLAVRFADRVWLIDDGQVHAGAPEDLLLSGAVGRVFSTDEVAFDLERGEFTTRQTPLVSASVSGNGAAAVWVGRGLARAGVGTVDPGDDHAELAVTVTATGFRLEGPDCIAEVGTIGELVETVRGMLPSLAGRVRQASDSDQDLGTSRARWKPS